MNADRSILGLGHRVNTSASSFSGQERTHGKMRDGGSCCLRRRVYRISNVWGTLTRWRFAVEPRTFIVCI